MSRARRSGVTVKGPLAVRTATFVAAGSWGLGAASRAGPPGSSAEEARVVGTVAARHRATARGLRESFWNKGVVRQGLGESPYLADQGVFPATPPAGG
ncbi:hypothetical protein [Cyanobium sp. LEGE 06113]|uniref:hypothetical protein n=1 Tax=Cyanobium sp. LEGE 06113 TaxID=1297573 RepID=UPI001D148E93|nr:hypothetical protein [Cyanobium sp. LEGE 06113]